MATFSVRVRVRVTGVDRVRGRIRVRAKVPAVVAETKVPFSEPRVIPSHQTPCLLVPVQTLCIQVGCQGAWLLEGGEDCTCSFPFKRSAYRLVCPFLNEGVEVRCL
jgi:hypothetical protein